MSRIRPRGRTIIVLALGVLAVLAAGAVDPAAFALLFDIDFLIALGSAGLLILSMDLRVVVRRVATSAPAVLVHAGVSVTRDKPHSLLP